MKTPAPADLHRWSEELARNPASLAFLPLCRAYRRLGRRDLALQLCLRGLEHHPTHVEAHALLALLYFEAGERAKAADEWATVLRLKPGNFEALRGMGFRYLEQGDITKARQHLERAALIRPDDATVQEALRLIRQREAAITTRPPMPSHEFEPWSASVTPPPAATPAAPRAETAVPPLPKAAPPAPPRSTAPHVSSASPPAAPTPAAAEQHEFRMPWETTPATPRFADASEPPAAPSARTPSSPAMAPSAAPTSSPKAEETRLAAAAAPVAGPAAPAPAAARTTAPPTPPSEPRRVSRPAAPMSAPPGDPMHVFDSMKGGPLFGVLLLDRRGLVLAGSLGNGDGGQADELGAILGGAIDEAVRTVNHLSLGTWQGMLLDCETAALHVTPIGTEALVVVAAHRDAPSGWLLRTAAHAASLAERFVGVYS